MSYLVETFYHVFLVFDKELQASLSFHAYPRLAAQWNETQWEWQDS